MQESVKFKSIVDIVLTDENGNIKHQETVENMIVATGLAHVATFAAGTGTGALTEAGIFNASSAGTMLNRVVFATVNKGASDTLIVT